MQIQELETELAARASMGLDFKILTSISSDSLPTPPSYTRPRSFVSGLCMVSTRI